MVGADDFLVKRVEHSELLVKMKVYSKLVRAEKHIALMNESLKKVVEAQADKLVQPERMASIGQLAAGVAHEINNPMRFITTNIEALNDYIKNLTAFNDSLFGEIDKIADQEIKQSLLDKKASLMEEYQYQGLFEDLNSILNESLEGTTRVSTIVKDLKTFTRNDYRVEVIDINTLIEQAIDIIWNQLKTKCKVIKELGNLEPQLGIKMQLSQVILNLLVNAGHAIDKKGTIIIKYLPRMTGILLKLLIRGLALPRMKLNKFSILFIPPSQPAWVLV